MTISQAETIIEAIEEIEKWQGTFEIKLNDIDAISGFDMLSFTRMRDIITKYKMELWSKANKVKENTEI